MQNDHGISEISFAAYAGGKRDALTWYDLLPGDGIAITSIGDERSAEEIAEQMLGANDFADPRELNVLAAKLVNQNQLSGPSETWNSLVSEMSKRMADSLNPGGDRALRMRYQRLVFCLRAILERGIEFDPASHDLTESILPGTKPWDQLRCAGGQWWISSDEQNIHFRDDRGVERHWSHGLPTQLDVLGSEAVAVGSLYSKGAAIFEHGDWSYLAHDAPVVLVFEFDRRRLFLDFRGKLWTDCPRSLFLDCKVQQVHFARCFEGRVFLLNNGDFGHITIVDLEQGTTNRLAVLPVEVCNDLVMFEQAYFLIDKQQGGIFKYDLDWQFEKRILRFGRQFGEIMDPVSIRCRKGRLQVVSWLNGKVSEVDAF